jgi:EAL domain-containing protein (putative c-di-GMP-specific phosphodiesterase class I)
MQAIIDVDTEIPVAYELLARDTRAKNAPAGPLMARLTPSGRRRLVYEAVNFAQLMAQVPQSPRIHVNLDLEDLDLVAQMGDLTNITIEIVEGSVDPDVLASAIDAIHERNGYAAMDDFGSPLWSGNALTNDWDLVKLDLSVLSWTEDRWSDLQDDLVKHCLDADVCLEGIETEEHLQAAKTIGANLLQGYACGVPLIPQIHPQVEFVNSEVRL